MSLFESNFPPEFNARTQRAYVDFGRQFTIVDVPQAVKDLQNIEDLNARVAAANSIAVTTFFPIDVQVDVWGWDPIKTYNLRRAYGYTWTPSALSAPNMVAPGLLVPGLTPYSPDMPGPFGIIVPPEQFTQA